MRLIGYARVSTADQKCDLQIDALRAAGCDAIYQDKVSGTTWTRAGLDRALADVRSGDKLAIWKIDRVGRSIMQILTVMASLEERGASLLGLTEGFDTVNEAGQLHALMLAMVAHIEHRNIISRTRAGLQAARKRGKRLGGKPKLTDLQTEEARLLMVGGMSAALVAERYAVARATLFRSIRQKETRILNF